MFFFPHFKKDICAIFHQQHYVIFEIIIIVIVSLIVSYKYIAEKVFGSATQDHIFTGILVSMLHESHEIHFQTIKQKGIEN